VCTLNKENNNFCFNLIKEVNPIRDNDYYAQIGEASFHKK
jgi:hypothetical protein